MIVLSDVGGELIFDDNRTAKGRGQRGDYTCIATGIYRG